MLRSATLFLGLLLALAGRVLAAPLPELAVVLPDGSTVPITAAVRESLPEVRVKATARGETREYQGYDLLAILKAAGLEPAESLRGPTLRWVVVAEGADGYAVAFALAELDPALGNRQAIVVHTADGEALPEAVGPWRLVVPGDGRPARWVRSLVRIAVREAR